jgi:tetratricopeptide (TPR) repeat protein
MKNLLFQSKFVPPLIWLFVVQLFLGTSSSVAAPIQLRVLNVGVAVSPGVKMLPEWKERFGKRLAYASKIFDTEFKLRFQPVAYWDWQLQDENKSINFLMEHLKAHFPLRARKVDLVIGISRLSDTADLTALKDMHVIGRAHIFAGYLVLREPPEPLLHVQQETVLTHELGHLFGAIHVNDRGTLMSPVVERQLPTKFDKVNREILSKTRAIDFNQGMGALDRRTLEQLTRSYLMFRDNFQTWSFYYALGKFYLELGQLTQAAQSLETALEMDSDNPQVHYDLGVLYSKLGDDKRSIKLLSKAASLLDQSGHDSLKASALNLLGASYFKAKNLDAAYRSWSRSAALRPGNIDARINLAIIEMERNQLDRAIKSLEEILKIGGDRPKILSNLGSAHFRKGNYKEAIAYLNRALTISSRQTSRGDLSAFDGVQPSEMYRNMAQAYLKMGQVEGAITSIDAACHLNPSAGCYRQLGQLHLNTQNWDKAIGAFRKALGYEKKDVDVYGILGTVYTEKRDYKMAIAAFKEGLKYTNDRNQISNLKKNIGTVYLRAKDYEQALKALKDAVSKNWENIEAHVALAHVYLGKNQPTQAEDSLKRALQLDPAHSSAKNLLNQIQRRKGD